MASDLNNPSFPPIPENIREIVSEAWPTERLKSLGPLQRQLLKGMLVTERHPLNVPVLQGMLEQVEEYFPEELIGSLPSLGPLLNAGLDPGE